MSILLTYWVTEYGLRGQMAVFVKQHVRQPGALGSHVASWCSTTKTDPECAFAHWRSGSHFQHNAFGFKPELRQNESARDRSMERISMRTDLEISNSFDLTSTKTTCDDECVSKYIFSASDV